VRAHQTSADWKIVSNRYQETRLNRHGETAVPFSRQPADTEVFHHWSICEVKPHLHAGNSQLHEYSEAPKSVFVFEADLATRRLL
jgi:hypothetical protein